MADNEKIKVIEVDGEKYIPLDSIRDVMLELIDEHWRLNHRSQCISVPKAVRIDKMRTSR